MSLSNTNCSRWDARWDAVKQGATRVAKGTAAGFLGGIIACWVMNQYQSIESRPVNVRKREELSLGNHGTASQTAHADGNGATVKVAQLVSRKLVNHELTPAEAKIAGPAVQYGYGATVGALYGGLSELLPTIGIGVGIPYATLLWLGGDEIAVPALGLAKPPTQVPAEAHVSSLAMHFAYGITLDISRRILRRLL